MLQRIKLRIRDMKTISKLISGADKQAQINGEREPGAEHFLLSALDLPDGTAKGVFQRLGADPNKFHQAINQQYNDALQAMGIDVSNIENAAEPIAEQTGLLNAKPSGQDLMKKLYKMKQNDKDKPLLGAHVLEVIAEMQHGVATRSLHTMGIDTTQIPAAVKDETEEYLLH